MWPRRRRRRRGIVIVIVIIVVAKISALAAIIIAIAIIAIAIAIVIAIAISVFRTGQNHVHEGGRQGVGLDGKFCLAHGRRGTTSSCGCICIVVRRVRAAAVFGTFPRRQSCVHGVDGAAGLCVWSRSGGAGTGTGTVVALRVRAVVDVAFVAGKGVGTAVRFGIVVVAGIVGIVGIVVLMLSLVWIVVV